MKTVTATARTIAASGTVMAVRRAPRHPRYTGI